MRSRGGRDTLWRCLLHLSLPEAWLEERRIERRLRSGQVPGRCRSMQLRRRGCHRRQPLPHRRVAAGKICGAVALCVARVDVGAL